MFTLGFCAGSSRNQAQKATAQTSPSEPKIGKAWRHPTYDTTQITKGGVNAPPHRALSHMIPCARTRSLFGSHVWKALVRLGKQPASPAPNMNCVVIRAKRLATKPVAAVKHDHHTTMRSNTRRGPQRSPMKPPGISNSE